jgi:hypothetical protein
MSDVNPTMAFSPYEISEDDITIEGREWDDDLMILLWTRHMLISDRMFSYWKPYYDRGKTCFNYEKGDIFTAKQRKKYKKEDKICVEPRLVEQRVYSLIGQILRGRRSGSITTEGGSLDNPNESSVACEIASIVMKDMEKKFKERQLEKDLLHNALISCFPNWAWIEKESPSKGEGVLKATLLPWDSVAVAPFNFLYSKDITTVAYRSFLKEAELLDYYPEMEEQIRAHRQNLKDKDYQLESSISEWNTYLSSEDRSTLFSVMTGGRSSVVMPDSFYEVIKRVFQIRRKEKIAINLENPNDFHVRPPDWDTERWNAFIQEKKDNGVEYSEDERLVTALWETTGTSSGLIVQNKHHWYQENGRMPGSAYWPAMIDADVCGPGEKMLSNVLKAACAETEFLDEVMKGSGSIWLLRNGYISNIDEFQSEVSKANGTVFIKGDFPGPLNNVAMHIERKPNPAMLEYAQKVKIDIEEETRLNQSMQGASQGDQSGVAKSMEIAQGMVAQTDYVENFNNWWEDFQDLKCSLIPYGYDQYDIIEIVDEKTSQKKSVEINAPVAGITGEIIGVANDLTAHNFRFKLQPVDDSPTAKAEEQRQAIVFLNAVPGPLSAIDPSGETLAYFMMSLPNRILQDAGKKLLSAAQARAQQQQQQAQTKQLLDANERLQKLKNEADKIRASKIMFSVTGEQLAQFPMLAQLLNEIGYFTPPPQQLPPESQGALPAPEVPGAEVPAAQELQNQPAAPQQPQPQPTNQG